MPLLTSVLAPTLAAVFVPDEVAALGAGAVDLGAQAPIAGAWKPSNMGMPDYTDFKGLPIKTVITVGPNEVVTTIVSVKQDPVGASEFEIPKDFQELKQPIQSTLPADSPSTSSTP